MDIKHVAKLANLPLTKEEEEIYSSQLDKVIEYVQQLQKVDISAVGETSQVTGTTNVSRSDTIKDCPKLVDGYIKVKAIFGND